MRGTDEGSPEGRARAGRLAGAVGIFCNLCLFVGKFAVGELTGSMAITADAFNNLSDAAGSVMSLLGFWLGAQKPDREHPFGHARYEYLAGMMVCVMILLIGLELAKEGILKLLHPEAPDFGLLSVGVLVVSILVKLWLSAFNRTLGERIRSDTLKATAADAQNDCLTTAAVLAASALGRVTGWLLLDGLAAVAVAVFILYSGCDLLRRELDLLLGCRPNPELVEQIERTVRSYPNVLGMHDLLVHDYGPGNQFASLHIEFDAQLDALKAHDLIDDIERDFWKQQHLQVVIHYDPIVTTDCEVTELRDYISQQLSLRDPRLGIHDLRLVPGDTQINVLFDLQLPADFQGDQNELLSDIMQKVKEKNRAYICAIKVDRSYF